MAKFESFHGALEEVVCPTCGPNQAARLLFKGDDGIGFYQCKDCNIQFASPRFAEESLLEIYDDESWVDAGEYEGWSYDQWKEKKDHTYWLVEQNLNLVKNFLPERSTILDVGSGIGLTVRHLNENNFVAEGLEPSSLISSIARENIGAPLHNIQIEDYKPGKLYDGVLMLDVLEHLYDPVRVLQRCSKLTRPGGYIFIHVPHHRGLGNIYKTARCRAGIKSKMKHFGFPWHIYSFDRKSLNAILGKADFIPVTFESWSHLLTEGKVNIFTRLPIYLAKKLARSDYIVCVAKKED